MRSKIKVTESRDLGFWFGIDGVAIKNQPQLDLAVIALAGLYGLRVAPKQALADLHNYVHSFDDENDIDPELVTNLISVAEVCTQYLNSVVERGYKFTFTGDDYSQLELVKVA